MFSNILTHALFLTTLSLKLTNGNMEEVKESEEMTENSTRKPYHSEVLNTLFKDYEADIVPIKFHNHTVNVSGGLAMVFIEDLSSKGVLSATTWLRLVWNDFRLMWNQTEFGNVSVVRVDPWKLWVPDIELFNAADTSQFSLLSQMHGSTTNALIYPDGEVIFVPPVNIKVICHNFTHSNWPQGEQECNIKLGSWTHDGLILNLSPFNNKDLIDLTEMSPASPWLITKQMGKVLNKKTYPCCPEPYYDLNFRFKLKPQYPMPDPSTTPHLLYQLLIVSIITLCVVVLGGGWSLWTLKKEKMVTDDYKMRILQE